MTRDVPIGSEVYLNIRVDTSQKITVIAHVPLLNADFPATFHHEPTLIPAQAIRTRFELLQKDIREMWALDQRRPEPGVSDLLASLDRMECSPHIEKQLVRAEGREPGARQDAHEQVLQLAGALHLIGKRQIRARIEDLISELQPLCRQEHRTELDNLRATFRSNSREDFGTLEQVERMLKELKGRIRSQRAG